MEFIEPDRSNYIVSAHKPNDEGVRDIGFVKGTFLDGRPYRLECWCMDELIMASVFFDERYLTAWKRLDFALLLELEGVDTSRLFVPTLFRSYFSFICRQGA